MESTSNSKTWPFFFPENAEALQVQFMRSSEVHFDSFAGLCCLDTVSFHSIPGIQKKKILSKCTGRSKQKSCTLYWRCFWWTSHFLVQESKLSIIKEMMSAILWPEIKKKSYKNFQRVNGKMIPQFNYGKLIIFSGEFSV